MNCVFAAELAEFTEFNTIGVIFFVLHTVVIPLLALHTRKCDLDPHFNRPP